MIVFITFPWNNVATIFRHNHELIILFNSQRYKKQTTCCLKSFIDVQTIFPFFLLKTLYIYGKRLILLANAIQETIEAN